MAKKSDIDTSVETKTTEDEIVNAEEGSRGRRKNVNPLFQSLKEKFEEKKERCSASLDISEERHGDTAKEPKENSIDDANLPSVRCENKEAKSRLFF